jgi:hypothetical protein
MLLYSIGLLVVIYYILYGIVTSYKAILGSLVIRCINVRVIEYRRIRHFMERHLRKFVCV